MKNLKPGAEIGEEVHDLDRSIRGTTLRKDCRYARLARVPVRLTLLLDLLGKVILDSNLFDGPQLGFKPIDVLL